MGWGKLNKIIYLFGALIIISTLELSAAKIRGLSNSIRISSQSLKYDLQYKVYVPPGYKNLNELPVIYMTDGQGYINHGHMPELLSKLIKRNKIEPVIAVFIDARDPHNLSINRRYNQFICNKKYINFVKDELVNVIDSSYKTSADPNDRVILGLSLGGLNAACFGLLATNSFKGFAIQSPAMYPIPQMIELYKKVERIPIKIFLSTGTIKDDIESTRAFHSVLVEKGYPVLYREVEHGHNWKNWKPLLGDILLYFFPASS